MFKYFNNRFLGYLANSHIYTNDEYNIQNKLPRLNLFTSSIATESTNNSNTPIS